MVRFISSALLLVVLVLCLPYSVSAHAYMERSTPLKDAELQESPTEIRIKFTEKIDPELSEVTLENADGSSIQGELSSEDSLWLIYNIPKLSKGIYKVKWQVLSVDTHVTEGSFQFSVDVPIPKSAPSETVSLDEPEVAETLPGSKSAKPEAATPTPSSTPKPKSTPETSSPKASTPAPGSTSTPSESPSLAVSSTPLPNTDMEPSLSVPNEESTSTDAKKLKPEPDVDSGHGNHTENDLESGSTTEAAEFDGPGRGNSQPEESNGNGWQLSAKMFFRITEVLAAVSLAGFLFYRYCVWGVNRTEAPLLFSLRNERRLGIICLVVFAIAGLLDIWTLADQLSGLGSLSVWDRIQKIGFGTLMGNIIWLRIGIAGGLLAMMFSTRWNRVWILRIKAIGIFAIMVSFPLTGHAISSSSGMVTAIISHLLHMLAASVWFGGLIGLFVTTFQKNDHRSDLHHLDAIIRRFSRFALPLIIVVAFTGVGLTVIRLQAWSELIGSAYGQLILLKSGILLLVIAIAAFHRLKFMPQIHEVAQRKLPVEPKKLRSFIIGVRWEIVCALVLFILAGMLSSTSPS